MKNNNIIRESIEQNLFGMHVSRQQQLDMIDEIVGGRKMKRKMPLSIALVAVLAIISMTALAVSANIFSYFSNRDTRYENIAPQAGNITSEPAEIESAELGNVNARIDGVYYDGMSLSVGFIIENSTRIEAYTPTADQLAAAELIIDPLMPLAQNEDEQRIIAEFCAAVESGEPYGYAIYRVNASDHTTVNGIDMPLYMGPEEYDETGAYRAIREFEQPLPEEFADCETLNISIQLYETASVHYFDGVNIYHYSLDRRDAGAITATAARSDAELRAYSGSAEIDGITFSAEADLSIMQGKLVLTADQDVFQPITYEQDGVSWQDVGWNIRIFDENGVEYDNPNGYSLTQFNPMEIAFEGSGKLPNELHVYLLRAGEEPDVYNCWPDADKGLDNEHIVLTIAE